MALTQEQIRNLETYDPEAVGAPSVEELVVLVDHPSFEQPMKAPYIVVGGTIVVDPDLSREELLTILGVSDILETTDLTDYVAKVTGKSLINDTEITRLSLVKRNVYSFKLPTAESVAERCVGVTELPTYWEVAADIDSGFDLSITHGTGRRVVDVFVSLVDGTEEQPMKEQNPYNGWTAKTTNRLVIHGLTEVAYPIVIHVLFAN